MAASVRHFALFAITLAGLNFVQSQECAVNQCPGGEVCYDRNVANQPNFVCECDAPSEMGHNCLTPTEDIDEIFTCYGPGCETGSFSTPGWPTQVYANRYGALYLLYIPNAERIDFTFSSPFAIETLKDELYVGPGLSFTQDQLDGQTVENDHYFFEGSAIPAGFSVESDTVWMAFLTDKNVQLNGFQINWASVAVDSTPPVINNCPQNIAEVVELGTTSRIVSWLEPTATDESGIANLVLRTNEPGTAFPVGSTTVTYVFQDGNSNNAICSFTITISTEDTVPPTISNCPSNLFESVQVGTGGAVVNWVEPTATDISATTVSSSHTPGSFFPAGTTTTVTYTFRDSSGNEAVCSFTVTVEQVDDQPPVITNCPQNMNLNVELGTSSVPVSWVEPSAVDNSGVANLISQSHFPNTLFNIGSTTVTYVYSDESNNIAQCSFVVTVTAVDTTPPTILNCPSNTFDVVELGVPGLPVSWSEPSATDISGPVSLQSRSHSPGDTFPVGSTIVTYVFQDSSFNEAVCTFTVTVTAQDTTPPVISDCPVGVVRVVELGTSGTTASWTEPTATDNSGFVNLISRSHAPNDFFEIGATVVTYTFSDSSGNEASCSFTVNIVMQDTIPPTIANCPAGFNTITELGTGGAIVTWLEPTATDLSNVANLILRSHEPGSFFLSGTTTVTYQFSDADDNIATCTFDVIVSEEDTVPPVVSNCPAPVSVNIELGQSSSQAFWIEPTATDISGQVNLITRTHQPGDSFPLGTTTVTYLFSDNSGNTSPCTFTVTVGTVDNTPPTISNCPPNIDRTVELGSPGLPVSWLEPTATDLGAVVTLTTRSHEPGSTFNIGTTTVTYIFTDNSGNSASCVFTVTVVPIDTTPPTISNCPTNIAEVIEVGTNSATVFWTEPSATDLSGQVITTRTAAPGSSFAIGPTTVTYTFTDNSNNVAECTFVVSVVQTDTIPPTIQNCPADLSSITELGSGGTVVTWTEPTAVDLSGVANLIAQSHQSGSFFPVGMTEITYTYADNSGNSADCVFTVTVNTEDTVPPVISDCPSNINLVVELGTNGAVASWVEPTATDLSGDVTLVLRTNEPGSSFNLGTTTVTYIFRDSSSNSAVCSFVVTVMNVDTTPPDISNCPSNIDVTVELGIPGTPVVWMEPTATDLSGTVSLTERTHAPGNVFPVGMTLVTYTFTDGAEISAMCSFVVNVVPVDTTPPTISDCPANIAQVIELGTSNVLVQWPEPSATDESGQVILVQRSHAPGAMFSVGSTTVTYRFSDNANNVADCVFVVTVVTEDTIPPSPQNFPDNIFIVVELGTPGSPATWPEPTFSDVSGVTNVISQTNQPGDFFPIGSTDVTYVVSDPSGNTISPSFTVTVVTEDTTPPDVSNCPSDIPVTVELGTSTATAFWQEPSATDISGVVNLVSRSHSPGDAFPVGTTPVTYIFSDSSGNNAICTFQVVVSNIDTQPPVISNCPSPIPVTVELGSTGGVAVWTEPTATDISGSVSLIERTHSPGSTFPVGTTVVSYTFQDNAGNIATCTFPVTVTPIDTIPPSPQNFPDNIFIVVELGTPGSPATWPEPTFSDVSGVTNVISQTNQPGDFFPVGSTDVTYVVSDPSGNTISPSFTVTVVTEDTIPPSPQNFPDDIFIVVELGTPGSPATWPEPTFSDVSGVTNVISQTNQPGDFFPVGSTDVTYVVSDPSGNTISPSFSVTVVTEDTTPPDISNCPSDIPVTVELGTSTATAFWQEPSATDISGVVNLVSRSHSPGDAFPVGTTPVTYIFSDSSGNNAICTFQVVVSNIDTQPPVISNCPSPIPVTVELGSSGGVAVWTEPTATDISGSVSLIERTHSPGSTFPVGTTVVSYTFQDNAGNIATCTFPVTVTPIDTIPPSPQNFPDNIFIVVELGTPGSPATWPEPTFSDVSGVTNVVSQTNQPGDFFPIGSTDVTYVVSDPSGNTISPSFTVTVVTEDTIPPSPQNFPDDIFIVVELGTPGSPATWPEPTFSDVSGVTNVISQTNQPGDFFPVGSTDVTYVVSDPSGNTISPSFSVTVVTEDTTPPDVSNCPSDIPVTVELGTSTATAFWQEPSATDISGVVNLVSRSHFPGDTFPVGTTPVTYIFSDSSGNNAICTFQVVVSNIDTQPPVISNCPSPIPVTVELGSTGGVAVWTEPTATDISGSVSLIERTHSPGSTFPVGTTVVSYTFQDNAGNIATCTFPVTVTPIDTIPPSPQNFPDNIFIVVELGTPGSPATWPEPTFSDVSGVTNVISQTNQPGDFFPVGSTDVTYVVSDPSGNTISPSFTVTVLTEDTIPPSPQNFPDDIFIVVELGTPGSPATWPEPTFSDVSGVTNVISQTNQPGDFFPIGSTDVTYVVSDPSGNTITPSFTVTVVTEDTIPPAPQNFPDNIFIVVELGTPGSPATWPEPTFSDVSGVTNVISQTNQPGDFFPIGSTDVTYVVSDPSGNTISPSFTVTVVTEDTIPPSPQNFPDDIFIVVELGTPGSPATWPEPTFSDVSGVTNVISQTNQPGDFFPIGSTDVTYVVSDPSGNTISPSFTVTVVTEDTIPPSPQNFPDDIFIVVELGTPGSPATWPEPTFSDVSGITNVISQTNQPGDFFPIGSTDVTYVVSDPSGNTISPSFTVTVVTEDTIPPAPQNFPDDIFIVVELGTPGSPATWPEPTFSDVSGVTNVISQTNQPGDFFPVGSTDVTYVVSDPSGNTISPSFTVTVVTEDTTPPDVSNCPSDIPVTVELGTSTATAFWQEPSATDISGVVNLVSRSHSPGDTFPVGTTPVTYIFSDSSGNNAICTFQVVVSNIDTQPPVISNCPSPIPVTVELGSTGGVAVWTEPTPTDISGSVTLVERTHSPGSLFPVGTTVVSYTFADNVGNQAVCSFPVIVTQVDTVPPTITNCPSSFTVTVELGTTREAVTWTEPTASDLSGTVTLVQRTSSPNSLFVVGSTAVTYTFSDNSGNSAECTFTVTVVAVDTTPPTILQCPSDITAESVINTGGVVVTWVTPTAVDISAVANIISQTAQSGSFFNVGTTEVRITFADASGNTADCVFNVVVIEVDPNPPTIFNCPEDIERIIQLNDGGVAVFFTPPQATDDSGIANLISQSHNPGQFFPTGITVVTYIFSDPSSNTAQCVFTVTVIEVDSIMPIISSCPVDLSQTVPLGSAGTVVTWVEPQVSDNSGIVNLISQTHTSGSFFVVGDTSVIYTYADPTDNRVICSFVISVIEVDDEPPVPSCPSNILITIFSSEGGRTVTWTTPEVTDNSGQASILSSSHQSGAFFTPGVTEVTYTFIDGSGNQASCQWNVIITEVNPCSSDPCQNGAACVVTSETDFFCVCPGSCFTGTFCEVALSACSNNLCENGALCVPVQDSCTQYTCECPACFTGPFCNIELDACLNNQCQNGGQCVQEDSCTTYRCECPPCFTGEFCEEVYNACDDNACLNGAVCSNIGGSCTEYTCSCPSCFTGALCQFNKDPCNPNPCQNNAICTSSADESCFAYSCQCVGCFTGYNCEVAIPSGCATNPCQNGAVCSDLPGTCGGYTCTCLDGFAGVRCQDPSPININPCNSSPCEQGSTCLTMDGQYYICVCRPGYYGINCDEPVPGQDDPCDSDPCLNGATCRASYNANSSPQGQYVSQYTCICQQGFTGANCQVPTGGVGAPLDICNLGTRPPCENGGTCANSYHSYDQDVDYFCFCLNGFTGHNCEATVPDPCSSSPCQNNAGCTSFSTYYTCSCLFGFSGTTCEIITSADTTGPTVTNCPSNTIQVTAPVGSQGVASWQEPFAVDSSGVAELVYQSDTPGSTFPLGTSPVAYVFADLYRNPTICLFFVRVTSSSQAVDNTPPSIVGGPDGPVTALVPPGATTAVVTWPEPTASDDSQVPPTLTQSHFPGSVFPLGTTTVSYIFVDPSGNQAILTFDVVVAPEGTDNTPPVISDCPSNVIVNIPGGMFGRATWSAPTATDDSGTAVLVSGPAVTTGFFSLGSTPLSYVFEDAAGNQATCSFEVIVSVGSVDNTPPVISGCPQDIVLTANSGASSAIAFWNVPSATDDSGMVTLVSASASPGNSFLVGSTQVTYTFSDPSSNTAECSFTVTVNPGTGDVVPPTISNCPAAQTITAAAGASSAVADWVVPTATDASGVASVTSTANPGDSFPVGLTTVSYRFTDSANNIALCEFQILVLSGGGVDMTPPVISNCPEDIQQTIVNGQFVSVSWTEPTAVDESGGEVSVSGPGAPVGFFTFGVTTLSYIFTDAAGNTATCSFDIIIADGNTADTTPPVISNCPSDIFRQIPNGNVGDNVVWTEPTATDDVDTSLTVDASHAPGDFFPVGATLVVYTFTDDAGNSDICSFSVNIFVSGVVVDSTPPVISNCPAAPIELIISSALDSGIVTWSPEPTAVDDQSSVTVTQSHLNGAEFSVGDTLVTYSFEDESGNQANCSFTVTITRGPNPCAGDPCPSDTACFYSRDQFLCLPQNTRKRRDLLSDNVSCPCQNNGTCHHSEDGEVNYCECAKGFSGILCETVETTMKKESEGPFFATNLQWSMDAVLGILLLVITVLAFTLCYMAKRVMYANTKQRPDEVAIIH